MSRLQYVLLCLLISFSLPHASCPEKNGPQRVLFLFSYHIGQYLEDGFLEGIQSFIDSNHHNLEVYSAYLDGKRFPPPLLDSVHFSVLKKKYGKMCLDAIVTADNLAFQFALSHRDSLFTGVPLLFIGVNGYSDSLIAGHSKITGITENPNLHQVLNLIDQLMPDVQDIYLIADRSEMGLLMYDLCEKSIRGKTQWTFHWWNQETYSSLLDSVAQPHPHSAAIFLTYSTDGQGHYAEEKIFLKSLARHSKIPLFVLMEDQMTSEVMGGVVLSGNRHGQMIMDRLYQVLKGTPADSIPILTEHPSQIQLNAPILEQYSIPKQRIPHQAKILHPSQPSLWKTYPYEIISISLVLILLTTGILILWRLRNRLRTNQIIYQDLVQHANTAIIKMDPHGTILFANEFCEKIFEYKAHELIGKNVIGSIVPQRATSGENQIEIIDQLLKAPHQHITNENENQTKSGQRLWVRWHNSAQYDNKGHLKSILSAGADITEKKLRDQEIAHFYHKVAHDLKSPLITIGSFAGMLRQDIQDHNSAEINKDLDFIERAIGQMDRLLRELNSLFKIGYSHHKPSRFSIYDMVEEARILTEGRRQHKNIDVRNLTHGWLTGHRNQFVDVFQNLLDNASKHTNHQQNPYIEIGITIQNKLPTLYVRDNGEGISEDYLESIFDVFVKVNPKSEGTGLGLSLVRRIIQVHGGRIWAESSGENHGTTFYMTLDGLEITI